MKGLESWLNPKDYQNVPAAVTLLMLLSTTPTIKPDDSFGKDVILEFELLGKIFKTFLSFFAFTNLSLEKQLVDLATLAHYLFYIYRRNKTAFMTKDLYMDIQSTIQDAFICAATFKSWFIKFFTFT